MASKRSAVSLESESGSNSKKSKRQQIFLDKYKETWPFARRGKSDMHAFCEICACDLGIGSGGRDDIRRHVESEKHKKNVRIRDSQKANAKLTQFFGGASSSSSEKTDLAVMRAETMMVDLAGELNLSINSLDTLNKAVKRMFPDSKIAQSFQCGRTKATALEKEMAAQTTLILGKRIQQQPFTISTDGSNDRRAEKLFPLVVRTVDPKTMEVRSDVLAVPALQGSATGQNIVNLIDNEFIAHNVPWENCLSVGCDNANVMVGAEKGVYALMKKKNPHLYLSGCVCHLMNISAQKGASCLPFDVGQLRIDIYYYLDKSSKRYSAFNCMQVLHNLQEAKFIKHVSTRWLSIGKCLPRLISNWDALLDFFKAEEESTSDAANKTKAGKIRSKLQSNTFKVCAMFLLDAIQPVDEINTKLQSEEPQIHVLRDILHKFLRTLLLKFVKPSALQYKLVTEVDFKSTYNVKQKSDLIIGDKARQFLTHHKNKFREERIEEFYTAVQNFYKMSCEYIKKKLPLDDELLRWLTQRNSNIATSALWSIFLTDSLIFSTQRQQCQPSKLNFPNIKVQTSGVASVAQVGLMLRGGR